MVVQEGLDMDIATMLLNSGDLTKLGCALANNKKFLDELAKSLCPIIAPKIPYCLDECGDQLALEKLAQILCQPLHRTCLGEPPSALPDTAETRINEPVIIDVLANDLSSSSQCTIDETTLEIVTPPVNGTAIVLPDWTIEYTPTDGFVGNDTFTYRVSDTCCRCATAVVVVTVTDAPIPPVCQDVLVSTDRNVPVEIDLSLGVDVEGTCEILSSGYTVVAGPYNGLAPIAGGIMTYTPNEDFVGYDVIDILVTDECDQTCQYRLLISVVMPEITPPVCNPDIVVDAVWGVPVVIDVIDNDVFDPLCPPMLNTLCIVDSPNNGDAVANDNGTITYTPNSNFCGTDTIIYQIMDECMQFCTGTVTIEVQPPGTIVEGCTTIVSTECSFLVLNLEEPLVCPGLGVTLRFCDGTVINILSNGIVGDSVYFQIGSLPFSCANPPASVSCWNAPPPGPGWIIYS